jgi:hypothetical protein
METFSRFYDFDFEEIFSEFFAYRYSFCDRFSSNILAKQLKIFGKGYLKRVLIKYMADH